MICSGRREWSSTSCPSLSLNATYEGTKLHLQADPVRHFTVIKGAITTVESFGHSTAINMLVSWINWMTCGNKVLTCSQQGVFGRRGRRTDSAVCPFGCAEMADSHQKQLRALIPLTLKPLIFYIIKPTYTCTGELNWFSLVKTVIMGHTRRYSRRSRG